MPKKTVKVEKPKVKRPLSDHERIRREAKREVQRVRQQSQLIPTNPKSKEFPLKGY